MRNFVIFGYNRLSVEAVNHLDKDCYNLLIVDSDEEKASLAAEKGYATANIDFRSDDELKAIGLGKHIDTIFCFLPEDSENVFLTISARAIDPNLKIISIVEDPDAAEKLIAAGANKVIDPYQICGRKIHEMIKKPDIANIIDQTVFGRHDLHLAEVVIPKDSPLENTDSSQLNLSENYDLVLIGVVDKELGEDLHFVLGRQNHRLNEGDILVILGPSREIRAFKKEVGYVEEI